MRMLLLLLCASFVGTSWAQGATQASNVSSPQARTRMVIAGASYAGDWKQPDLPGYEVVNKGVGGDETSNVLARFEKDVLQQRPQVVLIWGHINNIHRAPNRNFDLARQNAKSDYEKMIALARQNGIKVILATEVTLPEAVGVMNRLAAFVGRLRGKTGYSALINGHVREVNSWLRTYAAKEGIQVLDFEKVFDDGEGFRKVEYTTDDGSHINAAGYRALTAYTREQLKAGR